MSEQPEPSAETARRKLPWWIWMLAPVPVAAVVLLLVPPGRSPPESAPQAALSNGHPAASLERRPLPAPIPVLAEPPESTTEPAVAKVPPHLPRTEAEVVQARSALKERERRLLARRAALNPLEREAIRDLIAEIRSYNEDLRAVEAQAARLAAPVPEKAADLAAAAR